MSIKLSTHVSYLDDENEDVVREVEIWIETEGEGQTGCTVCLGGDDTYYFANAFEAKKFLVNAIKVLDKAEATEKDFALQ